MGNVVATKRHNAAIYEIMLGKERNCRCDG